ncbi:MAG: hypothetical protein LBQ69_01165 [Treponema sp.]|nr:hypothetical protein [Treponema sp.]
MREDFCKATDATGFFPAAGGKKFFTQKCGGAGAGIHNPSYVPFALAIIADIGK